MDEALDIYDQALQVWGSSVQFCAFSSPRTAYQFFISLFVLAKNANQWSTHGFREFPAGFRVASSEPCKRWLSNIPRKRNNLLNLVSLCSKMFMNLVLVKVDFWFFLCWCSAAIYLISIYSPSLFKTSVARKTVRSLVTQREKVDPQCALALLNNSPVPSFTAGFLIHGIMKYIGLLNTWFLTS